jgi:hypothetical protein
MAKRTGRKQASSNQAGGKECHETFAISDDFVERGGEKIFGWSRPILLGSCLMQNASITIRADGTASWRAEVSSTAGLNAWGAALHFRDRNLLVIVRWPFIYSPQLIERPQVWVNNDLAIVQAHFPFITSVFGEWRC